LTRQVHPFILTAVSVPAVDVAISNFKANTGAYYALDATAVEEPAALS
jgi:hypothetical protein